VGIELSDILQAFPSRGIQHRDTATFVTAEGYIDFLFGWIVSNVVGVLSDVHRIEQLERISVVDSEFSICAIRDEQLIELAHVNHTLRIGGPADAVYVATCKRVYDFDRVVAESGSNDAFPLCVEREMIDTASHVR
jgi:hypothetical protein